MATKGTNVRTATFWASMATIALVALSGCADGFESREDRILNAVKGNDKASTSSSKAVWLVKESSAAPNDRNAVFFGYYDNLAACNEFVEGYNETYSAESYRCDQVD